MAETESRIETCRRGHRWRASDSSTYRPGGPVPVCPFCGEAAESFPPPDHREAPSLPPSYATPPSESNYVPRPAEAEAPAAGVSTTSSNPAIPGYQILGVVGGGTSGVVYKARETAYDRLVALRVVPAESNGKFGGGPHVQVDPRAVRLRNPNIVPVLATGRHGDSAYVASELAEGKRLAEVVAEEPLPVLVAAQLTETLARAVQDAARNGVVHGHLKPANIVFVAEPGTRFIDPELGHPTDESGRELTPKITGYGVQVVRDPAGNGMAPAQSGATPAADVSGLGAILYVLLTGRQPVEVEEQNGQGASGRGSYLVPPSSLNSKVPRDLEAICLTSLGRDPSRRFPEAGVLADALQQFLDSFVTHFLCSHCGTTIRSTKPLRIDTTQVRCPRCGQQTVVEAINKEKAPSMTPPPPAPVSTPVTPAATRRGGNPDQGLPAFTPPPSDHGPFTRTAGMMPNFPSHTPPSHPSQSQLTGLPQIGGYTLLGELGRGGMGTVYKARHEKLKRVVALKMIAVDPDENPHFLARFQAEAEAVARLHHPNIVQIYEVGEQDGWPFLALEFVTGGTLKKRLDGRPQPVRPSVQLVQLIAKAVHAAHLRGIVHRDLKPANILLEPTLQADDRDDVLGDAFAVAQYYGVPKVNDFGLAKRIDDDSELIRLNEVLGTPLYMAPEQAEGHPDDVGPAADVYSLGVILYEMLTGRPPFVSASAVDVLRQVVTEEPQAPRQLRRQLHRDLEAICLRCLEKDPRKRYHSALALADDLTRFLEGEPVRARPPGPLTRLWSWSLRNPVPSTLLLTVSVVLVFGHYSLRHVANDMVESTAKESAAQQTELLRVMNSLYTEVASRAKVAGVTVTHKFPDVENSIPIPAKFTIELGQRIQSLAENSDHAGGLDQGFMQLKEYSAFPFRHRSDSPPKHQFGKDALAFYRDPANKDQPFSRIEKTRAGSRVLRYSTPLFMEDRCLKCHNDPKLYEIDRYRKTDWEAGDVRGVLEIVCPLENNAEQTQRTLFSTYFQVAGAAALVLALSWIALTFGKRHRG